MPVDTVPAFKFHVGVEVDSVIEAMFTECSGLSMEREVITWKEGGVNDFDHKLPGRTKYTNITLKRGITTSNVLWDWFQKGIYDGSVTYINMSVTLYDNAGNVSRRWNLINAFPIKWMGPALKSDSNQAAVESLEIAFQKLELE